MISSTTEIEVKVPLQAAFNFITQDDVLPRILVGTTFMPRVIRTEKATGPWNTVGSRRVVHLAGGATAQEELLSFTPNSHFQYKVSNFTFMLKHFTRHATGQWWFTENSAVSTSVKWSYSFAPHNPFTIPLVWLFTRLFWKSYMKNAMIAMKTQLEEMKQYNSLPCISSVL